MLACAATLQPPFPPLKKGFNQKKKKDKKVQSETALFFFPGGGEGETEKTRWELTDLGFEWAWPPITKEFE